MTLELTEQESQIVIQLLDIAVKAGGLQVSEAALLIAKKIQDASDAQNVTPLKD